MARNGTELAPFELDFCQLGGFEVTQNKVSFKGQNEPPESSLTQYWKVCYLALWSNLML